MSSERDWSEPKNFPYADVAVAFEPHGAGGRGLVRVTIPIIGVRMRMTLEDAETLGEALINCVRQAEAASDQ